MENKSIKVLLVEDNPSDTQLIGVILKKATSSQFELVVIEQLGQALQQLEDEQFDVILLDLVLPDSQGLDTFSRIYAQVPNVPIILLTGLDDETLAIQTVQAGAQDYLVKGQMEYHLLVRAIRYAVERQQLRLALKASEARLCAIIKNNADGIVVVNQAGIVQFVNPSAEALFGRSTDELVGKTFDFPIKPTETSELNLVGNDGQTATVEMRVVETAWSGESAYLASLRDITDRKRAEEALHENERRLSTLMDNLPGMAYRCLNDEHWTMEFISKGCSNLTGYKTSDLIGNQRVAYNDLIHPDDRAPVWKQVQEALAERRSFRLVYRIRTVSGKEKWVWEQGEGVFSEKGEVLALEGFITDITERKRIEEALQDNIQELKIAYEQAKVFAQDLTRDITERKRVEEALRESEERYRDLINGSPNSIIVIQNKRVVFANLAGARMFGFSKPEQIVGRYGPDMIAPAYYELVVERMKNVAAGKDNPPLEMELLKADGTTLSIESTSVPIMLHGEPAALLIGQDITERKRVENLLRVQRDLVLATNADPRLDETLRLCLDAVVRVSGMDCGGIYLVEEDSGDLELVFHQGLPADFVKSTSHYAADSVNAHLVMAGKPIYTQYRDLGTPLADTERRENLHAIAVMPVHHQGRVIACLNIASHTADEVPDFARTALETIVTQIGGAIAHARAVEALWKSEERYALAARGANDGLWDWDIKTNQVYFSPRWKSMLGYEENEIGHSLDEWFNRIHPEDLEEAKAAITAHREGRLPHLEYEYRMLHRDGVYRWMLSRGLAVRDATGQAYRMAGSQTDITERKMTEAKLMHDAFHDPLTGLPNGVFFIDKVRRAIQRAREREDYLFAVLFLDLDRFKIINDSLGHQVGDELLIAVGARLLMCLDGSDIIARFGGDEFAILLDDIEDVSDAAQVANRIQKQIVLPFEVSGQAVFTTVSIGIAPSTIGYDQPEECMRDADTAMYRAKANGRARHEIFSRDMHTSAVSLWRLDADLRRAVERREFQIHYQPIVSLTSGQITGAEALLRWLHPQRGLLDPAAFLPLAEEIGLIMPIGEWVLRQVCVHNKAWQANGGSPLSVAVNLSARQFQHQDLPNLIKEVLHETGLTAQALVLEVTESVATKNMDPNLAILHELSAMGIKISIDDFGIGSALDCLKRFPLNNLKIDQSFVKDVISDPANAAITRAIIDIAHSLNLTVIAEGVETEEQLAFLRSYQCDQIQGYLFSRPMPAEEFTKLLQQGWQLTNG